MPWRYADRQSFLQICSDRGWSDREFESTAFAVLSSSLLFPETARLSFDAGRIAWILGAWICTASWVLRICPS